MADDVPEISVVVRYTHYEDATPYQCIALMSWHTDLDEADAEAARLNSVRRSERVEYFVKIFADRQRRGRPGA